MFRWYESNHVKANPGKHHVMLSPNTQKVVSFDSVAITSSVTEKLLGITFDLQSKSEEKIKKFVI